MQLLYTSDLHGQYRRYQELRLLIEEHQPDVAILGGDLLPHYGHTQSSIQSQIQFIKKDLREFLTNHSHTIPIGFILGNDDWAACLPFLGQLADEFPIQYLPENPLIINNTQILGYSYVPPTPFLAKDFDKLDKQNDLAPDYPPLVYISENGKIRSKDAATLLEQRSSMEEDLSKLRAPADCVFVAHAPPFQTQLDRLESGQSVGSQSVLNWIKRHRPILSLHGHIHESPKVSGKYWDTIGNTICINPGQAEDQLCAVIIDIDDTIKVQHTVYGEMEL
ncbi:metallophosphoesterase [bacterium]